MFALKIVLSLIFCIACPIVCLLSIPFYIYRHLIKSLVKHFRPDWLGMLAMDDAVFYENLKIPSDPYYYQQPQHHQHQHQRYHHHHHNHGNPGRNQSNKPSLSNVMSVGVIADGEPNLDKIRSFFGAYILNYKNHQGVLPFRKLFYFCDTWWGYPFWRRSKYFDLNCHIRFLEEFQNKNWTTKKELDVFLGNYNGKPFPWKTPPWELVIVKNIVEEKEHETMNSYDNDNDGDNLLFGGSGISTPSCPCPTKNKLVSETKKFALIFRWHRTIADGYSVANIFINIFGGEDNCNCRYDFGFGSDNVNFNRNDNSDGYYYDSSELLLDPYSSTSTWTSLKWMTCSVISFGYELMRLFLTDFDTNIWRIPSQILCGSYHIVETNKLPLNIARTVGKKRKVSLDAVLFAAVAGGIRQYFIESGQQRRIPRIMKIRATFPSIGHSYRHPSRSDKLVNNWRQLNIRLPIGQSERWKALDEVHKSIEQQNKSLVPNFVRRVSPYMTALLPKWLNILSLKNESSSLTGWNFPGPKNQLLILGEYPTQDFICHHPKLLSDSALSLTIVSYNGAIKYLISVDKTLFPHLESALKLAKLIEKQFLSFQDTSTNSNNMGSMMNMNHYAQGVKE